jgi:Phosphotransacetylase
MIRSLDELLNLAGSGEKMKLAVAAAHDTEVLLAVENARSAGIIDGILVGDAKRISDIAKANGIDLSSYEVVDVKEDIDACRTAVSLVSSKKADFLMKGIVSTADLLRAVLDKEIGLRANSLLSHVMVYSLKAYHKLLLLTDGGMVINPDLQQKVQIIKNAVRVAEVIGIPCAKVAPLCAVETINPDMQSTVDAAILSKMNQRGQIKGCTVDGPLALDNAVSLEAAEHKKIISPVAGDADILLVHNIEAGNLLGKSLTYFAGAKSAGVIMGARCPIVLISRADNHESKLYSIALGSVIANRNGI